MTPARFAAITRLYPNLRIGVVGDFCLDRYLEIDPARAETSIETGLPVHNITRIRCQPGGAGTIVNNLAALGVGRILPVGFTGMDGEGWMLRRALAHLPGVHLDHLLSTPFRQTFTYTKPLVLHPGQPPEELNRLDTKNWSPTPPVLQRHLADAVRSLLPCVDALIVLDQVDQPRTGVVTPAVLAALSPTAGTGRTPAPLVIGDSRRGLRGWPAIALKMNLAELGALMRRMPDTLDEVCQTAARLARRKGRPVFVTLAERGIVGATPDGTTHHCPAFPVTPPIDVVGAGDAVTANLACALAAGAGIPEVLGLAMAAASVVVHQVGTTGTARRIDIRRRLFTHRLPGGGAAVHRRNARGSSAGPRQSG